MTDVELAGLEPGRTSVDHGITARIKRSDAYRSMFRHAQLDTPRGRALQSFSNFFLHLYPVKIPARVLKMRYSFRLGFIVTVLFFILVLTGVYLMFFYTPAVGSAYGDMQHLRTGVGFGQLVRNVHRWSAHLMVLAVFLHLVRTFYAGAYKKPREFNWVIGVVLLLLTLGLSFTGYLLPWDQLSYWAITVGTNIGSYAPFVGGQLREILLGGHTVGEAALLRFYVLHVAILPALIILVTIVHFWRVRKDGGLSRPVWKLTPPKQEVLVTIGVPAESAALNVAAASKDKTYGLMEVVTGKPIFETITPEEEADTVFAYPYAFVREAVVLMATVTTIMTMSLFLNAPLEELANPAKTPNPAKAPWYFLGLQELVSHSALIGGVIVPGLAVLALLAIPYIDLNPSRRPADRKWAIRAFTLFVVVNVVLIVVGTLFRGPGWALVPPWVHITGAE